MYISGLLHIAKKRLHYLQNVLQNFQTKWVALINKDREYFQYNSGDLVYLISPLTSQLKTASRKVAIRYAGPLVIYKIMDPHNYLLMTMDGKLLRGVFEHERIKPMVLKTDQGNVSTLPALKKGHKSRNNSRANEEINPQYILVVSYALQDQ